MGSTCVKKTNVESIKIITIDNYTQMSHSVILVQMESAEQTSPQKSIKTASTEIKKSTSEYIDANSEIKDKLYDRAKVQNQNNLQSNSISDNRPLNCPRGQVPGNQQTSYENFILSNELVQSNHKIKNFETDPSISNLYVQSQKIKKKEVSSLSTQYITSLNIKKELEKNSAKDLEQGFVIKKD